MKLRIQKYLSEAGICSRRKAEEYLKQGLIKINNKTVTEPGTKIDPEKDKIQLKSKLIKQLKQRTYIILNKPKGYVTTCAKEKEKPIINLIKTKTKVYPVGRLDKDTTGLILLTNDGTVAYRLTHPKFYHEKEYEVIVNRITDPQIIKLEKGVRLDKTKTKPTKVKRINKTKLFLTLTEGRYHHIKRICQKVGIKVTKLKRIRIENLTLKGLKLGQSRELHQKEIKELKTRLNLPQ